jgi:type IV fimbrial biogenesis protein FimT
MPTSRKLPKAHYTQSAFSLIEMLIVLALIAIVTVMGSVTLADFSNRTHATLLQSELLHAISFAREAAITHGAPVAICKSSTTKSCGGRWLDGQLIYYDDYQDGKIYESQQIIKVMQTHIKQGELHVRVYPFYRDYLRFLPTGFIDHQDGTFWFCERTNREPLWAIMISRTGKARVITPDKAGVIKDGSGQVLGCSN